MGKCCPGLMAESLEPGLSIPSPRPLLWVLPHSQPIPTESPGVRREVPMFGSTAQNSGGWRGCVGVSAACPSGEPESRVARRSQRAVNNAHSSAMTN